MTQHLIDWQQEVAALRIAHREKMRDAAVLLRQLREAEASAMVQQAQIELQQQQGERNAGS